MTCSEQQLRDRVNGIGGSDVAQLLNMSKWGNIADLYFQKTELRPNEGTTSTTWGDLMEAPILEMTHITHGLEIDVPADVIPYTPWDVLRVHLDGVVHCDGVYPIDAKAIGMDSWIDLSNWSKPNELPTRVPNEYYLQLQAQMMCLECAYGYIAVYIGARGLRLYKIERNERICQIILERSQAFWNNYVIPRVPPSVPPNNVQTLQYILRKSESRKPIPYDKWAAFVCARAAEKEAKETLRAAKKEVMDALGSAEIAIIGDIIVATYRADKHGKRSLVVKKAGRELGFQYDEAENESEEFRA